ncbi:MAG: hypothetical protein ACXWB9_03340 [Flavisolibacter sp.]
MSDRIHVLAQQIFNKPSLEACNLEEIRSLAERYPYFAPAQFLLLEKLKNENDPGYQAQLQRSVLYYHNPVAFEYFIASDRFYADADLSLDEPVPNEIVDAPFLEMSQDKQEDEEENFVAVLLVNHEDEPREDGIESNTIEHEISSPAGIPELSETGDITNKQQVDEFPVHQEREPEPEIPAPALVPAGQANELSFEPFHTVDYFASQGIKLSQEAEPADKFGRQLKSFTEWLRTMKKLPAPAAVEKPTNTEEKVQHMAEDSVHQAEVLTETMAEVWLKQGNTEKAIDTYNKLSLLNPSKMAYFAARIENLKRS